MGVIGKLGKLAGQLAHFKNGLPLTNSVRSLQIGSRQSPLAEVSIRGSNPGALRMFFYSPTPLPDPPALVVVLHGGMQNASGYDVGAGWSTLADRYGFALLMPEQTRSNNALSCFNWFQPDDSERGRGEALSIQQMIVQARAEYGIDASRTFITGLSAGGAMTSVMLATYPELFAGGAIIAGLPFGAATTLQDAFQIMTQAPSRSPREWGDRVRTASSHRGPWPKISVWHGTADATVSALNAVEIVKQWTDVHGLSQTPTAVETVDGFPRQVWRNADGDELLESYSVTGMAHGTPLATGAGNQQCGAAGPYLLDVGVSSSYHIARFFGLTGAVRAANQIDLFASCDAAAKKHAEDSPSDAGPGRKRPQPPIDVGTVIAKALTAAGLMKSN